MKAPVKDSSTNTKPKQIWKKKDEVSALSLSAVAMPPLASAPLLAPATPVAIVLKPMSKSVLRPDSAPSATISDQILTSNN